MRRLALAAAVGLVAACGPSEADRAKESAAKQAVVGVYTLNVERSAAAMPAGDREIFLKGNKASPPSYEVRPDGTWRMAVRFDKGSVVREGRWELAQGAYVFTPLTLDGNDVPGNPFVVSREPAGLKWLEEGTTSYLKVTGPRPK